MKLYDNPFYILDVSPVENRHQLMEHADEASLLGGLSVEDSVSTLMQMNKRIVAELGWFPGADPAAAAAFTAYIKTISEGGSASFPSVEGLRSPLAQANALSILFEIWPDSLPLYTIGLCRSLDMLLSKVTVSEIFALINEDRRKGGWESIPDEMTLAGPLEDRIRELCRLVEARWKRISANHQAQVLDMLLSYRDFDKNGQVCRTVSDAYSMHIHDEEESLREQILTALKNYSERKNYLYPPAPMSKDVEKWCKLTVPLRKTVGPVFRNAGIICGLYRQCIVDYFNNAPTSTKTKSKTVSYLNGTRTITLNYQSKENATKDAESLTAWLISQFPEQTELVERLKQDQKTLSEIVPAEEMRAAVELSNAK